MIYTATISSTSLRLRESRIVADLLLEAVSDEAWKEAVIDQNVLQMGSPVTVTRVLPQSSVGGCRVTRSCARV